jgi:dienelactone hydrolase
LVLIGYSGGGAVAALVAARRGDVIELVTVAGNLDHATWTAIHHVHPLDGSLNPVNAIDALQNIPQIHFVGERDKNVNTAVVNAYAERFPVNRRPRIQIVPEADHSCCWVDRWPVLLKQFLPAQ